MRFGEDFVKFALEFGGLLTLTAAIGAVYLRTGESEVGLVWLLAGFFAALTALISRPFVAVARWWSSRVSPQHWAARWAAKAVVGVFLILFVVGLLGTVTWLAEEVIPEVLDATC